jgi:mono/diheme cytochrome c family protein
MTKMMGMGGWLLAGIVLGSAPSGCDADGEPQDDMEELEPLPGDPEFERDPALDVEVVSAHGSERSLGMVGNCMGCHQPHGPGRGQFTVAGTVVGPDGHPVADPIVELRRPAFDEDGNEQLGELVATIAGDRLGNFYTTEALPLPEESLVPWVYSNDRTMENHMPWGGTISGACNLCHVGGNPVDLKLPE